MSTWYLEKTVFPFSVQIISNALSLCQMIYVKRFSAGLSKYSVKVPHLLYFFIIHVARFT